MYRGHVFFDWDDTLAENIRFFREAERRGSEYLAGLFNRSEAEVRQLAAALDLRLTQQTGLARTTFPTAWVSCYDELCSRHGRTPRQAERERVWALADWVFDQPQPLVEGAREVLQALRWADFELSVWTAGDPTVQARKIEQSGLAPLFDHRYVVNHKDAAGLRPLLAGRDPTRCVVVGNSASSDIRPALQLDLLALHIPVRTWDFDEAVLDYSHPQYLRLASLRQVPPALTERVSLAG